MILQENKQQIRDITHRDHREHLKDIINNLHNDQRLFWRWLKRTKQVAIFQGRVVSRVIEKARVFNQYFSSAFTKEDLLNVDKLREEQRRYNSIT